MPFRRSSKLLRRSVQKVLEAKFSDEASPEGLSGEFAWKCFGIVPDLSPARDPWGLMSPIRPERDLNSIMRLQEIILGFPNAGPLGRLDVRKGDSLKGINPRSYDKININDELLGLLSVFPVIC